VAAPRYIADDEGSVRSVALDGLCVLFHAPSGTTHIVAPPAPEILAALREGPADAAGLLQRLRARFAVEEDGADALAARLAELDDAGLVRREA
jgi:PqqD family protein of HPr-rel-A system